MTPRRRDLLAGLSTVGFAGCLAPDGDESPTGGDETRPTPETGGSAYFPEEVGPSAVGYTHLRADGNRVIGGSGTIPASTPIDHQVSGTPAWLVGIPATGPENTPGARTPAVTALAVVRDDGSTRAIDLRDDGREDGIALAALPAGTPPVAYRQDGRARLLVPPETASTSTHPIPVEGGSVFVRPDGTIERREDGETVATRAIDALPDARLRLDEDGRVVVLGGATDRYGHGVLGDGIEAGTVVRLDPEDLTVDSRASIPEAAVVEGIAPILADVLTDDGTEAIVTESDADRGARQVIYGAGGERLGAGPAIGTGFRWRHALAVAPFAADGAPELAVVRTPHIGGTVEFYTLEGDPEIVATLSGYSTHTIGSRNLDGGVAGDFDGDGRVELLVPTDDRRSLAGIRRTDDGAREAWRLPIGGDLSTNVLGVRSPEGITVAVGRADGTIRIWR
jgi:hypothetical protein